MSKNETNLLGLVADATGLTPVLEKRKGPLVDLNYDDPKSVRTRDVLFLKTHEIWLPLQVIEADLIISVPMLKTHHWAEVSLSLKNLFGIVPGVRYGWPKNFRHFKGIAFSILGLYQTVPNVVSVVDGIIGMEGDRPSFGNPVNLGLLVVGLDLVTVDNICVNLMGLMTDEFFHLFLANWAGVGQGKKIDKNGISPALITIPHQRPPSA